MEQDGVGLGPYLRSVLAVSFAQLGVWLGFEMTMMAARRLGYDAGFGTPLALDISSLFRLSYAAFSIAVCVFTILARRWPGSASPSRRLEDVLALYRTGLRATLIMRPHDLLAVVAIPLVLVPALPLATVASRYAVLVCAVTVAVAAVVLATVVLLDSVLVPVEEPPNATRSRI